VAWSEIECGVETNKCQLKYEILLDFFTDDADAFVIGISVSE